MLRARLRHFSRAPHAVSGDEAPAASATSNSRQHGESRDISRPPLDAIIYGLPRHGGRLSHGYLEQQLPFATTESYLVYWPPQDDTCLAGMPGFWPSTLILLPIFG